VEHGDFPEHQKYVEIDIDFLGDEDDEDPNTASKDDSSTTPRASATVLGSDLTNEYVAVNADYRS